MPIFRFKSVKIYTGQKNLHWRRQWRQWQLWGMCIRWHTLAYSGILWHTLAYSGILWHTLAYSGILWHALAYSGIINASLITADGAYDCPVGSIWPLFILVHHHLLWCNHLMSESQIYLKLVGVFVAIDFWIPINNVIHLYQWSLKTRSLCLSIYL